VRPRVRRQPPGEQHRRRLPHRRAGRVSSYGPILARRIRWSAVVGRAPSFRLVQPPLPVLPELPDQPGGEGDEVDRKTWPA